MIHALSPTTRRNRIEQNGLAARFFENASRSGRHQQRLGFVGRKKADPRVVGGVDFDAFPYLGGVPKHPDWKKP
jgi:hypothetical protein